MGREDGAQCPARCDPRPPLQAQGGPPNVCVPQVPPREPRPACRAEPQPLGPRPALSSWGSERLCGAGGGRRGTPRAPLRWAACGWHLAAPGGWDRPHPGGAHHPGASSPLPVREGGAASTPAAAGRAWALVPTQLPGTPFPETQGSQNMEVHGHSGELGSDPPLLIAPPASLGKGDLGGRGPWPEER